MKQTIKRVRNRRKNSKKFIIAAGFLMFVSGIAGVIHSLFFVFHSAAELAPHNTVLLTQIQNKFLQKNNLNILPTSLKNLTDKIIKQPNTRWIGKNSAAVVISPENSALLIEYTSKKDAENFLKQNFLVENETFTTVKTNDFSYKTAEYSSNVSYVFKNNWLVLTTNKNTLSLFNTQKTLADTQDWKSFIEKRSLNDKNLLFVSLRNLQTAFVDIFNDPNKNALLNGTTALFSSAGVTQSDQKTHISVFQNQQNTPPTIRRKSFVPEIFSFLPQNPVFLLSGTNLYNEKEQLKKSFNNIHPQYGILFEQIIPQVFGTTFKNHPDVFESFLEKLHGQYAIVSQKNKNNTIDTAFVSRFGLETQAEKIKTLNTLLKSTQAALTPTVETIELPNGKTRTELVAATNTITVQKKGDVYSLTNADGISDVSYGFKNGYLIVTNSESFLEQILNTTSPQSIGQTTAFRDFVLYESEEADSYGMIDPQALQDWFEFKESNNGTNSIMTDILTLLNANKNPFFFHRKTSPNAIEWILSKPKP